MKTFSLHPSKNSFAIKLSRFRASSAAGLICLLVMLGISAFTMKPTSVPVNAKDLIGTWQVDLRPNPEAAPYLQEFIVTAVDGNSFTGKFYNSEIKQGKINTEWGVITFAFVTSDGSGAYNTMGQLKNGKLEGATHSLGRNFLMPWKGEKK